VRATDLTPEFSRAAAPAAAATREDEGPLAPLSEIERRHVERVLHATGWNKAKAARVLEVDIKTLNKKIRDCGLVRSD
jgi:DNA-binding NtrC family response regulator